MERFAGLNIRSFNPIEAFMEVLSHSLGQKCLLFRERCLHSWNNFCDTFENCENMPSESFPIYSRISITPKLLMHKDLPKMLYGISQNFNLCS